ncbi:Hint domain-containing protein [Litorivita sp. NS0012-18]|uniref:Hint domain-containing protein n=1 Tax=Litorivita sp. NS0012-18 TaxID=3127655 RepID=UPI00310B9E4F
MPYTFGLIGYDDLVVSGPDPFGSGTTGNGSSVGATTFTLAPGATWVQATLNDNEAFFEDADSGQDLASGITVNGKTFSAGQNVETEYSYVVRPVGSTDPSEEVTIYIVEFGTSGEAIATDGPLHEGITYEIIAIDSNDPVVSYSNLAVCFTAGTRIATARGPALVEDLRAGDRVLTMDHGAQPLIWVGAQRASGQGATAPVRVPALALGNTRDLLLSPQHRVLRRMAGSRVQKGRAGECLTPVKSLSGAAGIGPAPCKEVVYYHLLLARHEVIFAEGAPVESMLPGPVALRALTPASRAQLLALCPDLEVLVRPARSNSERRAARAAQWSPARPLIGPSRWKRMQEEAQQGAQGAPEAGADAAANEGAEAGTTERAAQGTVMAARPRPRACAAAHAAY